LNVFLPYIYNILYVNTLTETHSHVFILVTNLEKITAPV